MLLYNLPLEDYLLEYQMLNVEVRNDVRAREERGYER